MDISRQSTNVGRKQTHSDDSEEGGDGSKDGHCWSGGGREFPGEIEGIDGYIEREESAVAALLLLGFVCHCRKARSVRGGSGKWRKRKSLSPIIGMSVNLVLLCLVCVCVWFYCTILCLVQLVRARLVKRIEFATVALLKMRAVQSPQADHAIPPIGDAPIYVRFADYPHSLPCLPSKMSEDTLCLLAAGITMSLILFFFRFRLAGCRNLRNTPYSIPRYT